MSDETIAKVHGKPLGAVRPGTATRSKGYIRPPKEYALSSEQFDAFLRASAAGMTPDEMATATQRSANSVRARCNVLGLSWLAIDRHDKEAQPHAREGFVPLSPSEESPPGLAGSPERIDWLQKQASEGRELWRREDRNASDAALRSAASARIQRPKLEALG